MKIKLQLETAEICVSNISLVIIMYIFSAFDTLLTMKCCRIKDTNSVAL